MEDIKDDLSLDEILQLRNKFSKKVFHNFLNKSYVLKKEEPSDESGVDKTEQIKSKKADSKQDDSEFESIFGCKRSKDYRPSIPVKAINPDKSSVEEQVPASERPEEKSAKYRPSKLRNIFKSKSKKNQPELRDPRFEQTSGFFNENRFNKSYAFIKEARDADKKALKKELHKINNADKKEEISKVIQRIENQEKSEKERQKKQQLKQKLIEEKRVKLKQKEEKPIYVNKGELKKKALVEKYKELKNSNQLNKYLERKRKKNTSRDRKLIFNDED